MSDTPTPGAIVLLTRLSRRVYRSATEDVLGMRMKQFVTLNHLRDHGPVTQQAISEVMCLDANSCVLLLNEAEAAGHARRVRDPRDRRRHIVEITAEGRSALKRAEQGMESVEDEILGTLDADDRDALRALLAHALEDEDVAPRDEALTQAS
jgi:DNA-binding MarR family transcriptional regulator